MLDCDGGGLRVVLRGTRWDQKRGKGGTFSSRQLSVGFRPRKDSWRSGLWAAPAGNNVRVCWRTNSNWPSL